MSVSIQDFTYIKTCSKCKYALNASYYYIDKSKADGLSGYCRECCKKSTKQYTFKNLTKIKLQKHLWYLKNKHNPFYIEKIKLNNKKWTENNRTKRKLISRSFYYRHHDIIRLRKKEYRKKYRSKIRYYENKKYHEDILFNLKKKLRNRIRCFLHNKKIYKFDEYTYCTPQFLKQYLEQKFHNGMSWDNIGKWHIDHIIPLSSAKTDEEIYKLCHYTNLQPLWDKDNWKKGCKIECL